ncbi:MAG TPA: adenosylcobinamide-phosphate synthase CbiB [Stellaceae bacterium]|nr:adenosylcobinamide-phosphate synthase CbiB [Stellaceae bacterium]
MPVSSIRIPYAVTPLDPHDALLLLLAGLVIDAAFGEMPALFVWLRHPVVLFGVFIGFFDRKLNRPTRSERARGVRGIITVVLLVGGAAALGWLLHWACRQSISGAVIEAWLIGVMVAQRSLYQHVLAVGRALDRHGLEAGREAVSRIVGRDPMMLDRFAVARAAIESLAENFSDGVVAPVFWYLLAGLPGLFAYKMANTLDSMIGHRTLRYRAFGWAAARFDDLLNLLPAPCSGILLVAATIFAGVMMPGQALAVMLRDGRKHRSPNAGWPEAAMAGALGISLAGPRHYHEELVRDPWLGEGSPRASAVDIYRALRLYRLACLLLWGMIVGVLVASHVTRLD